MATFVLVHGAHLGSWSWNLVISALNRKGHQAININLPEDKDMGAADYAESIGTQVALAQPKEDIILVGHSFAGLIIPLLANNFLAGDTTSIRRLIYIAPLLARLGQSIESRQKLDEKDIFLIPKPIDPVANRADAFKYWLHDCAPDIAYWAASRFRPLASNKVFTEITPLKTFPNLKSSVIVCTNDRLVNPQWIKNTARELLKVEPINIEAGHCPQLSRPDELALLLMQLGNQR